MIKFFAETYIRLKKKFKSAFTVIWDVESGIELIFLVVCMDEGVFFSRKGEFVFNRKFLQREQTN